MLILTGPSVAIDATVVGVGPTIVMIHGFGRDKSDFAHLAAELAHSGYCAVAINLRGVGDSTGAVDDLTLDELADDVAAVIAALDEAGAVVIGHAFGSRVARAVARRHAPLVHGLVLVSAGGAGGGDTVVMEAFATAINASIDRDVRRQAAAMTLFAPANAVPDSWVDGWSTTAMAHLAVAMGAGEDRHWWTGSQFPVLFIHGEYDRMAPLANVRELCSELGDRAELAVMPAGHALLPEVPRRLMELVVTFTDRVYTPGVP